MNSTTELICSEAADPSVLPHIRGLATSHLQGSQRIMGVQGEEVLQPEGSQDPSSQPWVTCTQGFCLISVDSMRTDYEVYRIRADSSLVGRGDSAGPSHWPIVRSALHGLHRGKAMLHGPGLPGTQATKEAVISPPEASVICKAQS